MTEPSPRSFKQYFSLTLDQVDEIQSKRGEYILYYVGYAILNGVAFFTRDPENIFSTLAIGILVAAVFAYWQFAFRFARVLRLMTYPIWMWIPACIAPALPLPGLVIVIAADRSISRSLTKALEQQE